MNAIEIKGLTKNFRMCGQRLESGSKRLDVSLISAYGEISMVAAMLLYMMAPLDSGLMNVILCFAAVILICVGFGAVSSLVLKKTSLV